MRKLILAMLAVLLVAGMASGATKAPSTSHSRGKTFTLCDEETATGVCDNSSGVDLFVTVVAYKQFTVYFKQSAANATCDIYVGDLALANNVPAILSASVGTKINSTQLSSTSTAQSFEAPFYLMWVICTVGSGTHTVTVQVGK